MGRMSINQTPELMLSPLHGSTAASVTSHGLDQNKMSFEEDFHNYSFEDYLPGGGGNLPRIVTQSYRWSCVLHAPDLSWVLAAWKMMVMTTSTSFSPHRWFSKRKYVN
jgi:hypothetical protein